jgi:hypothetical protein
MSDIGPESTELAAPAEPTQRDLPLRGTRAEQIRTLHVQYVPGALYGDAVGATVGARFHGIDVAGTAPEYAADVAARMNPRDPAEDMLVAQLVLTHARVLRLTEAALRQETIGAACRLHEYADRATNTYRRLLLGLAEYRRPARSGDTPPPIKQANIAGQQVVNNYGNATREQGSAREPAAPSALPADADRIAGAPGECPSCATVAVEHGAADAGG